jgi:hypothetical protein
MAYFRKQEELAYCKPSIMLVVARALDTLIAAAALAAKIPMDGPVWAAVRYLRRHTDESGVREVLPNGRIRELRVKLSQQEYLARLPYPNDASPIFRVAPHARIELLDCSKNGFRRAHVRIETDTGEWRELKIENRELEIMAKCLALVRAPVEENL